MNKSKTQGRSKAEAKQRPSQHQRRQPGREKVMQPAPLSHNPALQGSFKLAGKVALITGGDSGIGKAVAISYAREGADVALVYFDETADARETKEQIEKKFKTRCILIRGDIRRENFCKKAVTLTVQKYGRLDVLINNAAVQYPQKSILDVDADQLLKTFQTNIFSMFYLVKAALPFLEKQKGSTVINTTSVTAYRGSPHLLDYSATKGAIVSFTRSLSQQLIKKGIRVNAVAPGPIWTSLIPSTFPASEVKNFGCDTPIGRAGQPAECAESYVFLASEDSSYMTGQVLHPNGGEIING